METRKQIVYSNSDKNPSVMNLDSQEPNSKRTFFHLEWHLTVNRHSKHNS
jgi:hypothetical protein